MGLIIACLGHDSGHLVAHNYLKSRLLFQEPTILKVALNDVGTYIRKCSIDLNLNRLTNSEVAALAYYDLMFGQSAFKTDWQSEIANRCGQTVHIQASVPIQNIGSGLAEWKNKKGNL
jgi:hypothetical protein